MAEFSPKFKEALSLVQKPGRYTGGEPGCVYKDKSRVDVRMAFCFPDTYEIGMSFLGEKILNCVLSAKVKLFVAAGDYIGVALLFQFAYYRRAYHALVSCNVYLSVLFHHFELPPFQTFAALRAFSRFASSLSCFAIMSISCS